MDKKRWKELEALLQSAIKLNPADQTGFLMKACATQPSLLGEAREMLAYFQSSKDFLEKPAVEVLGIFVKEMASTDREHHINGYRLLEKIGQGGMGSVFLAEQQEPVKRRVALKVVKPGMDSEEILTRFRYEHMILAHMQHSHIARVYDAGFTEEGAPFFTMDYCPGLPIIQFCNQNHYDLQDRLALFRQVCEGVGYAHRKGIIHRDLKPTNLIVSVESDRPMVKIIDFGIAKAISGSLAGFTLYTRRDQILGTPAYMSPEQANGVTSDIDTRTDVYALGVVLYELLCGATPFPANRFRETSISEVIRIITEDVPEPPSSRAASSKLEKPNDRPKQLRGDLDWIVMKTLEKERKRRYGYVDELTKDIDNYLGQRPVSAGPPDLGYRLKKFCLRHRAKMTALTILSLALLTSGGGLWFALEERERASLARADAVAARSGFFETIFASVDPVLKNKNTKVVDILDPVAKTIESDFPDDPRTQARLHLDAGRTYERLGWYQKARLHLERSLTLRQEHLGPAHPETLQSGRMMGLILFRQGDFDRATKLFRETLLLAEKTEGRRHSHTMSIQWGLANCLREQGNLDEAETRYRQTIEVQEEILDKDHQQTLSSKKGLANLLEVKKQFAKAESLYREVLLAQKSSLGPAHPFTLGTTINLAQVLASQGKPGPGIDLLLSILGPAKESLGENHPIYLLVNHALGYAFLLDGNHKKAALFAEIAANGRKRVLGDQHPDSLGSAVNLGLAFLGLEQYEEAEPLLHAAWNGLQAKQVVPPEALKIGNNLAECLLKLKRTEQAELILRDVLKKQRKTFPTDHPDLLITQCTLAEALMDKERFVEALPLIRQSFEGSLGKANVPDVYRIVYEGLYGICLAESGADQEAEFHLQNALDKKISSPYREAVGKALRQLKKRSKNR